MDGLTRRDAVQRVMALMGGLALAGGDRLEAMALDAWSFDEAAFDQAMAQGVGPFSVADVALLDEIADTVLPTTSTPGAKAAKTGAFMALMVTDVYAEVNQRAFTDGLRTLEAACRTATGVGFMQATPVQRVTLLEALDREQKTATEEQTAPARTRFPATPVPEAAPLPHYFRMMKELALLGYFTSELGYTKALRYIESPGRFEPDVPLAPGDRSWAPHS